MPRGRWLGVGALAVSGASACAMFSGVGDLYVTAYDGGPGGSSSGVPDPGGGVVVLEDGAVVVVPLPPPAPGTLCNGTACLGHCCASQGGAGGLTAICLPREDPCAPDGGTPGLVIDVYCDEAADCASGEACCAADGFAVTCHPRADCAGGVIQLCGTNDECDQAPPDAGGEAGCVSFAGPLQAVYPFGKGMCSETGGNDD